MLQYCKLVASTACTKRDVLLSAKCVSVFKGCVYVFKEVSLYPHSNLILHNYLKLQCMFAICPPAICSLAFAMLAQTALII
jgi:hypothetical protein